MSAERDLFKVSDDFASLLRLRDIMLSEGEDVGPVEETIANYFSHDVTQAKIDTVIGALRHAEVMENAAEAEAERCTKLAKSYQTQREWLKGTVQLVMEMAGKKRLEGKTSGYLLLKGNGGKAGVVITDASLIEDELCSYAGTIPGELYHRIANLLMIAGWSATVKEWATFVERIPHKGRIAAAIERDGSVPGARFAEQSSHIEVK